MCVCIAALMLCASPLAHSEDGYDLWLRYRPVEAPWLERYRAAARELVRPHDAGDAAETELARAIAGMLGAGPRIATRVTQDGAIVFGTPHSSAAIAQLYLAQRDSRRPPRHGYRRKHERGRALRHLSFLALAANAATGGSSGAARLARDTTPRFEPLGQSRRHGRARLCRRIDLELARTARLHRAALPGLCPRLRVNRHQRHRPHQCQRGCTQPDAGISGKGGSACSRISPLRTQGVFDRPIYGAD